MLGLPGEETLHRRGDHAVDAEGVSQAVERGADRLSVGG